MDSLLPRPWNVENCGASEKRPLVTAFTTMKFPNLDVPRPSAMLPSHVPHELQDASMLPNGLVAARPGRTVALTMRLDLSPNAAVGDPELSSMDWSALAGICVEKTLFC